MNTSTVRSGRNIMILRFLFIIALLAGLLASPLPASGVREKSPLKIAYQDRVGDAAAILTASRLADDPAYSFTRLSSGSLTAEALISGTADLATMGDAVAVSLASRYPQTIVLLGVHGAGASRHKLVTRTERPRTIGVKFATSTHAALLAWVEEDVRLIDLSPDLQIAALASGQIDALAASEPTGSIALSQIEGVTARPLTVKGRSFPLVLVARRDALKEYPEQIATCIAQLKEAENVFSAELSPEVKKTLSEVTGLSEQILVASLLSHEFSYDPIERHLEELSILSEFLLAQQKIPSLPDWDSVIITR